MQTTLYASSDGVVDALLVNVGDSVESKDLIASCVKVFCKPPTI